MKDQFVNLPYTKIVVGDSILINKKILQEDRTIEDLAYWVVNTQKMTDIEAKEIFGKKGSLSFMSDNKNDVWNYENFSGFKVALFDEKYTNAVTNKNSEKIGVGTFNILSISKPMIREDKKYAIIKTSSESQGGVLSIYKLVGKKWQFLKQIPLHS